MAEKTDEARVPRNAISVVAQDTNWRTYVAKENKSADAFVEDWGFLTAEGRGKCQHQITERSRQEACFHQGGENRRARGAD